MSKSNPRYKMYASKPSFVEAVQVTQDNMLEVASWCGGDVRTPADGKPYIQVKVKRPHNPRQTQGYVGDWVLRRNTNWHVYTDKAFWQGYEDGSLTVDSETENPFRAEIGTPLFDAVLDAIKGALLEQNELQESGEVGPYPGEVATKIVQLMTPAGIPMPVGARVGEFTKGWNTEEQKAVREITKDPTFQQKMNEIAQLKKD
jgi:hypothetical protein